MTYDPTNQIGRPKTPQPATYIAPIQNPRIQNPRIQNPRIQNPRLIRVTPISHNNNRFLDKST